MTNKIEIKKNGEVTITTSDKKCAMMAFMSEMQELFNNQDYEDKDESCDTVEILIHAENAFVKFSREVGKIIKEEPTQ